MNIRPKSDCRWDLVALGEVMLRLDPGEGRIHTARSFRVWEGGGEYNVARGLRQCFGMDTSIVTALADNPVGRLVEGLILQGGVHAGHIRWVPYDGTGRLVRNGLNFTERGFGLRGPVGCSDRGHTAVSQLRPGDIDWDRLFGEEGARWFHTGGIFSGLSASTPEVAREAMETARRHGTVVSYDLNYRPSLWQGRGGKPAARNVNRGLVPLADVLFGLEDMPDHDPAAEPEMAFRYLEQVMSEFPNLQCAATTLRVARSATRNDWGGACRMDGVNHLAPLLRDIEVYDRIGGGDAFAAGLIYGLMTGRGPQWAVECGVAHGALTMTTPGDNSMATPAEVERLMNGVGGRASR